MLHVLLCAGGGVATRVENPRNRGGATREHYNHPWARRQQTVRSPSNQNTPRCKRARRRQQSPSRCVVLVVCFERLCKHQMFPPGPWVHITLNRLPQLCSHAVYMVGSQTDLFLAIHHCFVGTPPPLPLRGDNTATARLRPVLRGQPSLIAPIVVTPQEAIAMATTNPPTPMTALITRVMKDPVGSCILAQRDGRLSEQVLQFIGAAPQLATLRASFTGLAYTQVRHPTAYVSFQCGWQ